MDDFANTLFTEGCRQRLATGLGDVLKLFVGAEALSVPPYLSSSLGKGESHSVPSLGCTSGYRTLPNENVREAVGLNIEIYSFEFVNTLFIESCRHSLETGLGDVLKLFFGEEALFVLPGLSSSLEKGESHSVPSLGCTSGYLTLPDENVREAVGLQQKNAVGHFDNATRTKFSAALIFRYDRSGVLFRRTRSAAGDAVVFSLCSNFSFIIMHWTVYLC
ncbi:hypothetical protein AVEN_88985-1 [Araneus ventricosus]|uniref:Uncharacterized protein n=1 Tax=Araneus ventricosus TaxID=182803 RepID=A0A4Y2DLE5_ARAVE|nr:hypothetical protein AVEN_88985-1 [Araneus ventricosus]